MNKMTEGATRAEYDAMAGINQSVLKAGMKSAADMYHAWTSELKSTPAMEFGTMVHCAVLEPERFEDEYYISSVSDKRLKAWKEEAAANPGCTMVRSSDGVILGGMLEAMIESVATEEVFGGRCTVNEVAIQWRDVETGEACKALVDAVDTERKTIIDLKTTQDASAWKFGRSAADFGYDFQAAYYVDGMKAITGDDYRFLIISVETKPPHKVAVYEIGAADLAEGRANYRDMLKMFRRGVDTGNWPGLPDEVTELVIPRWGQKQDDGLSESTQSKIAELMAEYNITSEGQDQ